MLTKNLLIFVLAGTTAFAVPLIEGLETRQNCADVAVFFARGTTERRPIGAIVGPGLQKDLRSALGRISLAFTGVDYPANIAGYLAGGDAAGAQRMANSVISTVKSCPNTQIVMSGYSQGAQLVHLAADHLSAAEQDRVAAVVTFGDPYRDQDLPGVLESRRETFCAAGDLICDGKAIVLPPHLSYGADTPAAAAFIAARV